MPSLLFLGFLLLFAALPSSEAHGHDGHDLRHDQENNTASVSSGNNSSHLLAKRDLPYYYPTLSPDAERCPWCCEPCPFPNCHEDPLWPNGDCGEGKWCKACWVVPEPWVDPQFNSMTFVKVCGCGLWMSFVPCYSNWVIILCVLNHSNQTNPSHAFSSFSSLQFRNYENLFENKPVVFPFEVLKLRAIISNEI